MLEQGAELKGSIPTRIADASAIWGGGIPRPSRQPCLRSPHVAALGLVHHQQVAVNLVHQLWRDPAQRHPQLVSGHEIVFL
jgi:hypothetical protein